MRDTIDVAHLGAFFFCITGLLNPILVSKSYISAFLDHGLCHPAASCLFFESVCGRDIRAPPRGHVRSLETKNRIDLHCSKHRLWISNSYAGL